MKLTALCLLTIGVLLCSGCHYFYDEVGEVKRIPIPIPEEFPHEFVGEIYQVWMVNELQLKSQHHTAYIILAGVNNPDLGDKTEEQAIKFMHSLFAEPTITAVIDNTDPLKRMIANVFCGGVHINLEMVKNGWGTYDGRDGEYAEALKSAEEHAKSNNLGIWKD